MVKNYLKVTLRNLVKNKLYSLINIVGFAVSMACVVLIVLYVNHELSYDRHWEKADRTYKIMTTFEPTANYAGLEIATSGSIISLLLEQDFPQVEETLRIVANDNVILGHPDDDIVYNEQNIYFTDPSIADVFDIPLVTGSWEGALEQPAQMVINESLARKYFGDDSPVGQSLMIGNQAPVRITAVMRDLEDNTHLRANAFMSMATAVAFFGPDYTQSWIRQDFHTYAVMQEGADVDRLREEMPAFLTRHASDDPNDNTALDIMNVGDIHLHSQRQFEMSPNGSIVTVYTFSALAVFVLLIACFNFMNLSTARSTTRAREVGMRKTLGARRGQLVGQFLGESVLIAGLGVLLAIGLVEILLPTFNSTIDLNFDINYAGNPALFLALALLAVGVGLLAGSYPAFFLSSFAAVNILKGELTRGKSGALFRQFLVVLQFAIAIALVIAAMVVLSQLRFTNSLDLGFNTEQVAVYRGGGVEGLGPEYQAMKQELLRHPDIIEVTASDLMPGDIIASSSGLRVNGAQTPYYIPALNVDYDYFASLDIEFIAGRPFARERNDLYVEPTPQFPATTGNFILNETAVERLGLEPRQAVGVQLEELREQVEFDARVSGEIVGVIEDVYFESLHGEVQPMYFRLTEAASNLGPLPNFRQMAVKLNGNDVAAALTYIEDVWRRFLPEVPVQQTFLDQKLAALYEAEQRQGTIFSWFSAVAVFIAAIGLYGLASFVTEQRTREIGIRKVLGSTALGVVTLLSKDFSRLVIIANLIAWPLTWYAMSGWLQNFAYRIDLGPGIFLLAGGLALMLALITVGSLALRAANQSPVHSLRHE